MTSNSSGAVINNYAYSPFGESVSLSGTTFGYTGQRFDPETGLYYYKNRHYSPELGRFLQPDLIGYADGLNVYHYGYNDPNTFSDPLGLAADGSRLSSDTGSIAGYPGSVFGGGGGIFGGGGSFGGDVGILDPDKPFEFKWPNLDGKVHAEWQTTPMPTRFVYEGAVVRSYQSNRIPGTYGATILVGSFVSGYMGPTNTDTYREYLKRLEARIAEILTMPFVVSPMVNGQIWGLPAPTINRATRTLDNVVNNKNYSPTLYFFTAEIDGLAYGTQLARVIDNPYGGRPTAQLFSDYSDPSNNGLIGAINRLKENWGKAFSAG